MLLLNATAILQVISDQDLAGPLVFCLLFGGALLLHGKVSFGYIYGIGKELDFDRLRYSNLRYIFTIHYATYRLS